MAPPPMEGPAASSAAAVLRNDSILDLVLRRLPPADLVRAALACRRWRRAASLALRRTPPLLGYFFGPDDASPMAEHEAYLPAVFVPIDASSPRLSLDAPRGFGIADVHLGLLLLLPYKHPENLIPAILVLDPASRSRAILPPPPLDTEPGFCARHPHIIGVAVLSRAHPSKLRFEAICVTLDDARPRAWVMSVHDGDCTWRVFPRAMAIKVELNPDGFKHLCCFHDSRNIYWSISNSSPLLALDISSMEFSLLAAAPADLILRDCFNILEPEQVQLQQFERVEIDDGHRFPYCLAWPPAFLALPEEDGAGSYQIMNLIRTAIYIISYIRGLFPKEYFEDVPFSPTDSQAKKLNPLDEESSRFIEWVEEGINDAIGKKFLRTILFCISGEKGTLFEEYNLSVSYPDSGGEKTVLDLSLKGCKGIISIFKLNATDITLCEMRYYAYKMIGELISLEKKLDQIPEKRTIAMKLLYYDELTPHDYEPPFFKSCADNGGACDSNARDLLSLPGYIAPMPKSCAVEKAISSNSDTDARGYFLCTTRKTATFYFDSGSSRHICCDKELIENLQDIPRREKVNIKGIDSKEFRMTRAGEINCGDITLSPVFHAPDFGYNVISIGLLDDGNNLIYIGENRIRIIDVKEGLIIGEGFLHHTNNEYIARNLICKQSAVKRRKRTSKAADISTVQNEEGTEEKKTEKLQWILDSLCDRHMTGHKNILYDTKQTNRTFMTPTSTVKATHVGNARTDDITLSEVFYGPNIEYNLISEGQLDRMGFSCTRYKHRCKIQCRRTQKLVGMAEQDENMLYYVNYFHPAGHQFLKYPRDEEPSSSGSKKRTH